MPRKKKSRFRVGAEVRKIARGKIGAPPAERVIPDKRTKPVKHKKKITEDSDG